MTEFEKMINGEIYNPVDEDLSARRIRCREILQKFNSLPPDDKIGRKNLLKQLTNKNLEIVIIQAPFYCDYGTNIDFGRNVYMNFNCTVLDCAKVTIGDNTLFGPNVQIYTPLHPMNVKERITGVEYAKPVTIGENCWICGNVTILPGVTIGDNTVIGAGSVVTKDIPANTLAVGNPCKPIKNI